VKDKLIQYGFTVMESSGWVQYIKNEWVFRYNYEENYMWVFNPSCGDEEGLCLPELTYDKIIALIEFISEYK